MGDSKENLNFSKKVYEYFVFVIPAVKGHNLINISNKIIKFYSMYAPLQHKKVTIHIIKNNE